MLKALFASAMLSAAALSATAGQSDDLFKYVPQKENVVIGVDIEALQAIPAIKEDVEKHLADKVNLEDMENFKKLGLELADVAHVVLGMHVTSKDKQGGSPQDMMMAVRLKKAVSLPKILEAFKQIEPALTVRKLDFKGVAVFGLLKQGDDPKEEFFIAQSEPTALLMGTSLGVRNSLTVVKDPSQGDITKSARLAPLVKGHSNLMWMAAIRSPMDKVQQDDPMKDVQNIAVTVDYKAQILSLAAKMQCTSAEVARGMQMQMGMMAGMLLSQPDSIIKQNMIQMNAEGDTLKLGLSLDQKTMDALKAKFGGKDGVAPVPPVAPAPGTEGDLP